MSEYILKNFISGNINALSPDISTDDPVHFVVGFREDDGSDEEPVITLVRNLNSLRKKYPEFLSRGRMIKPPFKVTGDKWTLSTKNRGLIEHDSFFTSAWLSPEGKTAQFIGHRIITFPMRRISRGIIFSWKDKRILDYHQNMINCCHLI